MDNRFINIFFNDCCSFSWLRIALGTNEFLGATVITNLFSATPFVGESITTWSGAYSVDNPTLTRFFSLHYLIPLILGLVVLHIWALCAW